MNSVLQDILGLIKRKRVNTPSDKDYIVAARYDNSQEVLKPNPKMHPALISLKDLKAYISLDPTGDNQTLSLENNILTIENGNSVDLSSVQSILIPHILIGEPGGVTDYAVEDLPSNLVLLRWGQEGVNGQHSVYLPPIDGNVFRSIRFITDSTVDANEQIWIYPQAGTTIDGGVGPLQIDRFYEGLSLWNDGIEWYVIQAKAH
jgi:hypothetical protein